MTNGERIRLMNDEELAELMTDEPCPPLHRRKRCPEERNCLECWAEWLKMEVSARGASQVSPGRAREGQAPEGAVEAADAACGKNDPAAG